MNGKTAFPSSKYPLFPDAYPLCISTLKYDRGCAEAYPDDEE